ncbi:MAG: hypothetical protein F9K47_08685, partial [Burkholderiales bacterium]
MSAGGLKLGSPGRNKDAVYLPPGNVSSNAPLSGYRVSRVVHQLERDGSRIETTLDERGLATRVEYDELHQP